MKKTLTLILGVLFALVLTIAGCNCAGDRYVKIAVEGNQDTSYVVTSNGGTAVQYGNYVYFINGNRGYEDNDGQGNKFNSVVKGGLYRTELEGSAFEVKDGETVLYKDFDIEKNSETHISLVAEKAQNFRYEDTFNVSSQLISPKTIGTAGYKNGGIWIFGDTVYYASPSNNKNKQGETMDDYTVFFKAKLDGSKTEQIYTTATATSSNPYGFYNYNGKVYLVVMESGDAGKYVVSIEATAPNPEKTKKTIAENVESVIIPTNPVYYNGISTDTIYDFVYIKYSASTYEDDNTLTGYVLEYRRPDGENGRVFESGNTALDYVAVKDGFLFYKSQRNGVSVLRARDYDGLVTGDGQGVSEIVLEGSIVTSATEIYPYASGSGNINSNNIGVLVTTTANSVATLKQYVGGSYVREIASDSSIKVQLVDNNGTLFYYSTGTVNGITAFELAFPEEGKKVITTESVYTDGLVMDKVGSYFVYMGQLEGTFDSYTFFYDMDAIESFDKPLFVGTRNADDFRSSVEKIEINEQSLEDVKTEYQIGETLNVDNLKIDVYYYRDQNDFVKKETVDVEFGWVTDFNSTEAKTDLILTVTYTDKADSFTTSYAININE